MAKKEMWFAVIEDSSEDRYPFDTTFPWHEPVEILGEMRRWDERDAEFAASDAAETGTVVWR